MEFNDYKNPSDDTSANSFFVRSEYRMIKVEMNAIDYIESVEDYIKIYLNNARPILTLMTLKAMADKLPAEKFIRIHRSYIIPFNKIHSVLNKKMTLTTLKELPISDTYISNVNDWMNR